MNGIKQKIKDNVDALLPRLIEISDYIHANPELGHEEFKACALLCDTLEKDGFQVTRGAAGLETAFVAEYAGEPGGPVIAMVAEYDALPEIGHGCGHNIIASTAIGSAMALRPLMEELQGTLRVIGTPAEDTTGDKVVMIERGVFDDVDVSMQCHANDRTMTGSKFKAISHVEYRFRGVSSHASRAPEKGISALDAVMLGFTAVEYLRDHVKKEVSIAGIITNGGTATNSIPDFAAAEFGIRSNDGAYLKEVVERVNNCFRGAALATGAALEIVQHNTLDSSHWSPTLDRILMENALLADAKQVIPQETMASSDFCNVSAVLPTSRLDIAFAPVGTSTHSQGFADAGNRPMAHEAIGIASFAMAATAFEVFSDPALPAALKAEHRALMGR